ncbi:MAG: lysine--tRNA ligase [bacterium]|nr:lysine--tRNA ligase [bacterium]
MFWADEVANELKKRKLPLEWVDDMKTPSGKIHVGALRGVVIHDLVFKSLIQAGVKAKYTYVFENHDPMDALPVYLPKEKFEKYLGMPLYKIPSPVPGFKDYAEYYALDFKNVFDAIGCEPEIIWTADLYLSGKMNSLIKECLDKTDIIKGIYEKIYNKEMPKDWSPFQVYCPNCEKVSTTTVTGWDGKEVSFICGIDKVKFTKGCGFKGKIPPFSPNEKGDIAGKLPWKVEWPVKWKIVGVTVEGAGKDHMSKGGSHDLAQEVCKKVINYPVPYPLGYEFFLTGGKKMSSSKGLGSSAAEMLNILPPDLLRFLMVKTKLNRAINFDPSGDTIPNLFDDYQECANAYFSRSTSGGEKGDKDLARIFEFSQIGEVRQPPKIRFSVLCQWVQMPNMEEEIEKEGLGIWAKYAKTWIDRFAPEDEKFTVQNKLPEEAKRLSKEQKEVLSKISKELDKKWSGEDFQTRIYDIGKEAGLNGKQTFSAIYISLIGKDHGPKAGWLILSLDKKFVQDRFSVVHFNDTYYQSGKKINVDFQNLQKPDIFFIDREIKNKFPSISIGVAIIKGVNIEKSNEGLEKEKKELLFLLQGLTTEKLGQYPEILSYRKLYKEMGIDWHSRRPSPEALLRRVALKKGLYTVNTCVDAYNLVVMKNRVSVGAFDLEKISFPTVLRFAKEGEEILLLGDDAPTKYKEGEIAYFDKNGGYNIDFNFRDAKRTSVQLSTKNLYINVDGVYDIDPKKIEAVLKEACNIIIKYCGGEIELFGVEV